MGQQPQMRAAATPWLITRCRVSSPPSGPSEQVCEGGWRQQPATVMRGAAVMRKAGEVTAKCMSWKGVGEVTAKGIRVRVRV